MFLFNLLFWSNNNRTKFSSHHNQVLVACFKKTCTLLCCMSVLQALGKTHSVHISADFSLCALLSSQGIFVRDKTHTCALGGEGVVEEGDMYQQHICWGHFPNWGGDHCPQGRGAGPVRIQQLEEDWLSAVMSPSVLVLSGFAGKCRQLSIWCSWSLSQSGRKYFKSQSFTIFNPKLWGKVLNLVWFKSVATRSMWINQRWNLN